MQFKLDLFILSFRCGDLASVRYLVENASCDTSCANEQGEMALHFACKYVSCLSFAQFVKHI